MNLGTARITVIVALVVVGVIILVNGFDDGSSRAVPAAGRSAVPTTPPPTSAPPVSPTPSPTPAPKVRGVVVKVFNGTTALGLAAQAQDVLKSAGYSTPYPPLNSPVPGIPKTIVYFRGGPDAAQNESDATAMADRHFKGAKIQLLGSDYASSVEANVQVVVVLGQDYASAHAA